jgi:hypothetical protein
MISGGARQLCKMVTLNVRRAVLPAIGTLRKDSCKVSLPRATFHAKSKTPLPETGAMWCM